jgi:TP901 family phage tail tape measure protein
MAEYNLGTARGTIEIDYRGSGVQQATQGLGQARRAATDSDEAIRKTGTGFTIAGAAIAGGLGLAINSAADFEKGLSGIQAVSGASAAEMEVVRKKALQLGADTAFSASDASSAIEELVKAGISIPDVMNGAADATVALAAAGGVDLPQAATIASNAMNQFGLSAKELPGIADKIAGAANASAIDVTDMGTSMAQVGAVAHLAGLSFDDTALAITAMGNAGIKGSDAGTSLKTMLSNLQPSTKKAAGVMKELGIITKDGSNQFYDAKGNVKSMADIAGVLQGALKGMSSAQKQAALQTMFGSDAIRAAAVISEQGAGGMNKLTASINKVKAADVAKTRLNNLSGQVEQLKGSTETLAIGLGSVFIPILNKIVGVLTNVVNWFTSLDSGTQKLIAITAAFVGGLLLFVGGLIKAVQAAQAMKVAMLALNGTFLANPITWVIIAIVALIAAIVLLWNNSETFRNIVMAVWNAILNAVKAVAAWFTGTLVPALQGVWNSIVSGAQSLWASIVAVWNGILSAVQTALTGISNFFQAIWNGIVAFFTTIWNFLVGLLTAYLNMWKAIFTGALNAILAVWNAVWGLFGPLVTAVWNLIKAILELAWAWIKVGITAFLNGLQAVWTSIWNAIKAVTAAVWNGIKAVIMPIVNAIRSFITAAWNAIKAITSSTMNATKSVVSSVWNAIKSVVSSVMNAINSVISSIWSSIYSAVSGKVNSIKSIISSVFNAAKTIVSTVFGAIATTISDKINSAKQFVQGGIDAIKGFFSGAGSWLIDAGAKIIGGLIEGIKSMIGKVTGVLTGLTDKIRSFLPGSPIKTGPLRDHGWNQKRPGKQLVGLITDGIEEDISKVSRAFSGIEPMLPTNLTTPSVAARLAPVSASSQASSAPVAPAGDVTNHFDVTIPVEDLAGIQTVQEFFNLAQRRGRQRTGVTR